jgi:hypothetical protein
LVKRAGWFQRRAVVRRWSVNSARIRRSRRKFLLHTMNDFSLGSVSHTICVLSEEFEKKLAVWISWSKSRATEQKLSMSRTISRPRSVKLGRQLLSKCQIRDNDIVSSEDGVREGVSDVQNHHLSPFAAIFHLRTV